MVLINYQIDADALVRMDNKNVSVAFSGHVCSKDTTGLTKAETAQVLPVRLNSEEQFSHAYYVLCYHRAIHSELTSARHLLLTHQGLFHTSFTCKNSRLRVPVTEHIHKLFNLCKTTF